MDAVDVTAVNITSFVLFVCTAQGSYFSFFVIKEVLRITQ